MPKLVNLSSDFEQILIIKKKPEGFPPQAFIIQQD
jgi:hypothetical protein